MSDYAELIGFGSFLAAILGIIVGWMFLFYGMQEKNKVRRYRLYIVAALLFILASFTVYAIYDIAKVHPIIANTSSSNSTENITLNDTEVANLIAAGIVSGVWENLENATEGEKCLYKQKMMEVALQVWSQANNTEFLACACLPNGYCIQIPMTGADLSNEFQAPTIMIMTLNTHDTPPETLYAIGAFMVAQNSSAECDKKYKMLVEDQ